MARLQEDPSKLYQQVQRGNQARHLLEGEVFPAAVRALETDILVDWRQAVGPDKTQEREYAHARLTVLDDLTVTLLRWVEEGRVAETLLSDK